MPTPEKDTIPPTQNRSRAPEFYGFVAWTSTSLAFVLYVLWALLPDDYIVWLGVEWYPSREWALLIPAYSVIVCFLTYFSYFALAIAGTPAFSDMSTITDSRAHPPPMNTANPYLAHLYPNAIPELYDIPIGMLNRVAYGPRRPTTTKPTQSQPT